MSTATAQPSTLEQIAVLEAVTCSVCHSVDEGCDTVTCRGLDTD